MFLQFLGLILVFLVAAWFCGAAWMCLFIAPMFASRKWKETLSGFVLGIIGCSLMWYVFSHFSVRLS